MMSSVISEMTIRKCLGWQRNFSLMRSNLHFQKLLMTRFWGICNDFFIGKIEKICLELESCPKIPEYIESSYQTNSYFENFAVLTEMDVRKLVNKSATKSCELDPISTHFLKQHLDVLIPLVTKIVNISLQTGQFPNTLKSAIVRPLLKKAGHGHHF